MTRGKNSNRPKWLTKHHKVCKSIWGNNHRDNITVIPVVPHRCIHTLFRNWDTIDKINRILEDDLSVLQGDFVRDIQRTLTLYKWMIYHDHVLKKK